MTLDLATWLLVRDDLCKQHGVEAVPLAAHEIVGLRPSQVFELLYERISQTKWIEPVDYIDDHWSDYGVVLK